LSLAYSLNYGAQIIFGAIGPMALHHPERILTAQGGVILLGIAVCVVGVVLSGRAGILKDRSLRKDSPLASPTGTGRQPRMLVGLLVAILSGVLCACYSVAASYSGPVATAAQSQFGNEPWRASCATTAVILWGGAVSSCVYCAGLLTKNGTWRKFSAPGSGWAILIALGMAQRRDLPVQSRVSDARRPGGLCRLRLVHVRTVSAPANGKALAVKASPGCWPGSSC
jgi:L-rhamnose-H+ transport protein